MRSAGKNIVMTRELMRRINSPSLLRSTAAIISKENDVEDGGLP